MSEPAPETVALDPATIARLSGLELRAKTIVAGHLAGMHRSPRQGFSVEFAEHRNYTPGDDLRYLDWKVYARRDRYFLKQFEEETNFAARIIIDSSESMAYRSNAAPLSKWSYAACVAAALSWLVLRQQDAVGLMVFDDQLHTTLEASAQASQLKQILQTLEQTTPAGESAVAGVLHEVAERVTRRGLVLILSDLFEEPGQLRSGLKHLRFRGHDVAVIQVFDPAEQDFPFEEPTEFAGLEHSGHEEVEPRALRSAYQQEFERFLQQVREICVELQIDHILARTDQPFDQLLARFLSRRGGR